ncbi:MAG: hypothetical protein R8M37_01595 [Alphaproteobacteria bacterium]|nr:hypothetical protein [Alphaproteobacteria bacterium]
MKPTMLFAIILMISIVLMTSFNLTLSPTESLTVSAAMSPQALYVCPDTDSFWTPLSDGLVQLRRPIIIGFIFVGILLVFIWGWALYQNLLKDKFSRDTYKKPWGFTKLAFWAIIIVSMLMSTPNHYRMVRIDGAPGDWVLCENNTPGAKVVRASAVHAK